MQDQANTVQSSSPVPHSGSWGPAQSHRVSGWLSHLFVQVGALPRCLKQFAKVILYCPRICFQPLRANVPEVTCLPGTGRKIKDILKLGGAGRLARGARYLCSGHFVCSPTQCQTGVVQVSPPPPPHAGSSQSQSQQLYKQERQNRRARQRGGGSRSPR